jgi:hypothetical protein
LRSTPLIFNNPTVRYEIARALAFNKANANPSEPMPPELERHLLPERPKKLKWP